MQQVVAFTANNRPQYMQETADSWNKVRGIEDAHVIARVEPGNPEVERIAGTIGGRVTEVFTNPVQYGALSNPFHALETAFSFGYPFAILAEDDSPVADDVLEFFRWAEMRYHDQSSVLLVCAFQHDAQGGPREAVVQQRFVPTIWGIWRDRWDLLRKDWDHDYTYKGWDWRINEHWIRDLGYRAVGPCLSRSQVSGEHGGTHLRAGAEYQAHLSTCFSPHYEPGYYKEIEL
jgi:hypothetical protein